MSTPNQQPSALAVAHYSLPVSSAQGFVYAMEELAALEHMGAEIQIRSRRLANQLRAEMDAVRKRQQKENPQR